jgi:hypothetical protein
MKMPLVLLALFAALSVYAQSTPAEDAMESQINRSLRDWPQSRNLFTLQLEKANEIKHDGVTYSGILVEMSKTDNVFELINPAAPAEYGDTEDNTARDPISGKVSGLKFFSIRF